MTRLARSEARSTGGHDIKINGQLVNIYLAAMVYKCEECFGDLKRVNMGLKCQANHTHLGFIHRDAINRQEQQQLLDEVSQHYEIINGQIVAKEK